MAPGGMPSLQNPVEIRVALLFAVIFVGLKVATNLARENFGQVGVFGLSVLSGLVDVDPFFLSVVQGPSQGRLMVQAIIIAVMMNTLAKGTYFAALSRGNRVRVLWRYGLWAACHLPLLWI